MQIPPKQTGNFDKAVFSRADVNCPRRIGNDGPDLGLVDAGDGKRVQVPLQVCVFCFKSRGERGRKTTVAFNSHLLWFINGGQF